MIWTAWCNNETSQDTRAHSRAYVSDLGQRQSIPTSSLAWPSLA